MKIPRDFSGNDLIKGLERCGYTVVRQTGSHIRLISKSAAGFEHKITIPNHNPLKVGTLNSILSDVATYLKMDKQALLEKMFR